MRDGSLLLMMPESIHRGWRSRACRAFDVHLTLAMMADIGLPMPRRRSLPLLMLLLALGVPGSARSAEEEPPELAQARSVYQREVEFATRPIRDRYLSRLDALKRSLGSRGDARAAIAVEEEIDRVKAATADNADVARFAGVWNISYNSGMTNRWTIKPDGSVTWMEEARVALSPPRHGRIVQRNSQFVLEFDDKADRIWRVAISGANLELEFFQPRSTYPKGPPRDHGSGVSAAATK